MHWDMYRVMLVITALMLVAGFVGPIVSLLLSIQWGVGPEDQVPDSTSELVPGESYPGTAWY